MSLLLNALLVLITVGFLAFAGVAVYALILLIRRPPLALYEARKDADRSAEDRQLRVTTLQMRLAAQAARLSKPNRCARFWGSLK